MQSHLHKRRYTCWTAALGVSLLLASCATEPATPAESSTPSDTTADAGTVSEPAENITITTPDGQELAYQEISLDSVSPLTESDGFAVTTEWESPDGRNANLVALDGTTALLGLSDKDAVDMGKMEVLSSTRMATLNLDTENLIEFDGTEDLGIDENYRVPAGGDLSMHSAAWLETTGLQAGWENWRLFATAPEAGAQPRLVTRNEDFDDTDNALMNVSDPSIVGDRILLGVTTPDDAGHTTSNVVTYGVGGEGPTIEMTNGVAPVPLSSGFAAFATIFDESLVGDTEEEPAASPYRVDDLVLTEFDGEPEAFLSITAEDEADPRNVPVGSLAADGGSLIAFTSNTHLYVTPADGTQTHRIALGGTPTVDDVQVCGERVLWSQESTNAESANHWYMYDTSTQSVGEVPVGDGVYSVVCSASTVVWQEGSETPGKITAATW